MSGIVCGKRSNFSEDLQPRVNSCKRIRYSSPVRFSAPKSVIVVSGGIKVGSSVGSSFNSSSVLDHFIALFPGMDKKLLERTLEECCHDPDSTIKTLNDLRLNSVENLGSPTHNHHSEGAPGVRQGPLAAAKTNVSLDGPEWVEIFVRER